MELTKEKGIAAIARDILHVGDTIRCQNSEEMIDLMQALQDEGIETDFQFPGFILEITKIEGSESDAQ